MQVILIVAPVFALIAVGYVASLTRLLSEAAHKGISEFTFCIAMPALLFRTIALTDIPAFEPLRLWGAYFGAVAIVWVIATALTRLVLHRPAADAPAIAMDSVYGNIVMLGIPLALALYGSEAAAPMALILSINTPLLWMCATLHMAVTEHNAGASVPRLLLSVVADLGRNPVILAIVAGSLWHLGGFGLHPLADKVLALLGQSGVPCALVALGASLTQFQIKGQAPTLHNACTEARRVAGHCLGAGISSFRPAARGGSRGRVVFGHADGRQRLPVRDALSAGAQLDLGRGCARHGARRRHRRGAGILVGRRRRRLVARLPPQTAPGKMPDILPHRSQLEFRLASHSHLQ
jgi:malonate transporter and related proteins